MMNPEEIMQALKPLIRETGQFLITSADSFSPEDIEKKGFNDLVSYVDKEAEQRIVAGCRNILPSSGFITEEGTVDKASGEEYVWIIDPLDGTTNFVHGLPAYCVSIGLMHQGKLLLGAIYEPTRDELFHAVRDRGAWLNDQAMEVSHRAGLGDSLLATGFPYYDFGKMEIYLDILNDFMQTTHGLRRIGSAAIDLAYVACGRFEGFFEYNLNAWDVAAGALIVQEAGGRVTDFSGGEDFLFGRELIAATPEVHKEMLETIGKRWSNTN